MSLGYFSLPLSIDPLDVSSVYIDLIVRFNEGTQLMLVMHCGIEVPCRVALFSLSSQSHLSNIFKLFKADLS